MRLVYFNSLENLDINRKIQYKGPFSGQDAAKVSTYWFVLAANRDRYREPGGFWREVWRSLCHLAVGLFYSDHSLAASAGSVEVVGYVLKAWEWDVMQPCHRASPSISTPLTTQSVTAVTAFAPFSLSRGGSGVFKAVCLSRLIIDAKKEPLAEISVWFQSSAGESWSDEEETPCRSGTLKTRKHATVLIVFGVCVSLDE